MVNAVLVSGCPKRATEWANLGAYIGARMLATRGKIQNLAVMFVDFFFKNPISKTSAKFSSTIILKISWKNIEKCKKLIGILSSGI